MLHAMRLFLERLFSCPALALADERASLHSEVTMSGGSGRGQASEDTVTLEEILALTKSVKGRSRP